MKITADTNTERQAQVVTVAAERTLTLWASLALALVVLGLLIGGPS